MMRYPARPTAGRAKFEARAREHVEHLRSLVNEDGTPDHDRIRSYIEGNELWNTGVKEHFFAHQGRACA